MEHLADNHLADSKSSLYKWLSLITGVLTLLFSALNLFILHQISIGFVEAVLGFIQIGFFGLAIIQKVQKWHTKVLLMSVTFTMIYAFSVADIRAGSVYWLLLLPPLYCLLAGARLGFNYTLMSSIPILYLLFTKSDIENSIPYRAVMNFTSAYFLSYTICFFYEYHNTKNRQLLQGMAYTDPLTGAKNRHALKLFFNEFNKQAFRKKQQAERTNSQNTYLLIIDIDHFKKINDKHGHETGDQVLILLAKLLQQRIGKAHAFRIGGEEFLVTLKADDSQQAYKMAEEIRQNIAHETFLVGTDKIEITVSIGLSQLKKGALFDTFLRYADKNLYTAKDKGRNLVHHEESAIKEIK